MSAFLVPLIGMGWFVISGTAPYYPNQVSMMMSNTNPTYKLEQPNLVLTADSCMPIITRYVIFTHTNCTEYSN